MEPEREFMGRKKAKLWTYLIFGTVLVLGVLAANFAVVNPELTRRGVSYFLGLPVGAFPVITGIVGMLIYLLGLKIETDWPEALGALLLTFDYVMDTRLTSTASPMRGCRTKELLGTMDPTERPP
jgi:hypothetical protein